MLVPRKGNQTDRRGLDNCRYLYPVRHTFIDDPAGRLDSLEGFLHERQVRDAKHKKTWKSGAGGATFMAKMLIL